MRTRAYLWFVAAAVVVAFLAVEVVWVNGHDRTLVLTTWTLVAVAYVVNAVRALRQAK